DRGGKLTRRVVSNASCARRTVRRTETESPPSTRHTPVASDKSRGETRMVALTANIWRGAPPRELDAAAQQGNIGPDGPAARVQRRPVVRGPPRRRGPGWPAPGQLACAALACAESAELASAPSTRDDVAFWQYTSGTTGTPKAAVHLQHDMFVCCEGFGRHVLEIGPEDRTFSVAKLFFAYG